jgi:hypothetical protein
MAKRKTDLSLAKSQRLHATKRAWERYGLKLDYVDFARMEVDIANKNGKLISRNNQAEVWLLIVDNIEVPVVYNPGTKGIITILPEMPKS